MFPLFIMIGFLSLFIMIGKMQR